MTAPGWRPCQSLRVGFPNRGTLGPVDGGTPQPATHLTRWQAGCGVFCSHQRQALPLAARVPVCSLEQNQKVVALTPRSERDLLPTVVTQPLSEQHF